MCDQPQPTGIYQAMAEILAEIPSIGKDNKNKEQGFKYRGIDDVYNALHPLLAKHKVFMAPTVLSRASEDRTTAKGGAMQCVTLSVEYCFFHVNGVQINCEVIEYEKCTGEECPKWRDGKVDGGRCSYNGDCRKAVCNCASCPDRYGYCGG
ncbi:ERF family protein [Bilophila wadsworthia]|uniref:ERF family protein n=1 Tax=Bilophila wadsworthia TaxID=35833 RepID=UPI0032C01A19